MKLEVMLTADETNFLNTEIGFFIPSFFPGVPWGQLPWVVRYTLERMLITKIPEREGRVYHAMYGLRKIEAILVEAGIKCGVYSPQSIESYGDKARVFGVSVMDPLGFGPVSVTSYSLFGNKEFTIGKDSSQFKPPLSVIKFRELIEKLKEFDKPIIVGGSGANQFELLPDEQDKLGIDCILIGDAEIEGPRIFKKALRGEKLPKVVKARHIPVGTKIPTIKYPVSWGLVEISRGCDRHCKFCDPSLKVFRWIPVSNIIKEVKVNVRLSGDISLLSEDVFRYGTAQHEWVPNWGLVNLVRRIKEVPGVKSIGLSHACLASALAAPEQIEALREELNLSKEHYTSVQVGVETGSIRLVAKYLPYKGAPFEPDQWNEVVLEGWKLLCKNYIYPAGTLMFGLDDTEEDIEETIKLVKKLNRYPGMCWPLYFMPLGALRSKRRENFYTDWEVMSPKVQELFILCIEHMLEQTEKMDEHIFGTKLYQRVLNYLGAIFGKFIVKSVEEKAYAKGRRDYIKMGKILINQFKEHTRYYLKTRNYKSKFYADL